MTIDAAWLAIVVQTMALVGVMVGGWIKMSARLTAIEVRLQIDDKGAALRREDRRRELIELARIVVETHADRCKARADYDQWHAASGVTTVPGTPEAKR